MRIFWLTAAFLSAFVFNTAGAQAGQGHVYLLKGLANVFSAGLDTYAAQLASYGIPVTVANHSEAPALAVEAAQLSRAGKGPIIIIGHSLGGDAAIDMAAAMKQLGGKVALIVAYGPSSYHAVPSNVERVVNYYGSVGGLVSAGPGFRGTLVNVDTRSNPTINHFNMDKVPSLQQKTVGQILAILHVGRRRVSPPKTAAIAPTAAAH
jgi:pimeloyl-ACP methyl ester carboxylesterase